MAVEDDIVHAGFPSNDSLMGDRNGAETTGGKVNEISAQDIGASDVLLTEMTNVVQTLGHMVERTQNHRANEICI